MVHVEQYLQPEEAHKIVQVDQEVVLTQLFQQVQVMQVVTVHLKVIQEEQVVLYRDAVKHQVEVVVLVALVETHQELLDLQEEVQK